MNKPVNGNLPYFFPYAATSNGFSAPTFLREDSYYSFPNSILSGTATNGRRFFSPEETTTSVDHWASERFGMLIPAIGGAAAAFLFAFLSDTVKRQHDTKRTRRRRPGLIIYSALATAGISYYIYQVFQTKNGRLMNVFAPVSGAITLLIIYYAAVYYWLYRLDPLSFTGEIPGDMFDEFITFIYFSITTFATAGMGDMAPVTSAAKLLVSLEVLFFVYIFTMGLVFFADP